MDSGAAPTERKQNRSGRRRLPRSEPVQMLEWSFSFSCLKEKASAALTAKAWFMLLLCYGSDPMLS